MDAKRGDGRAPNDLGCGREAAEKIRGNRKECRGVPDAQKSAVRFCHGDFLEIKVGDAKS